jgi:hypothetical protein
VRHPAVAFTIAALAAIATTDGRASVQVTAPSVPNRAPMTSGSGAISGVAVDASTNQPISGVIIYLGLAGRGPAAQPNRQTTDAKGRFVFSHLPSSNTYFINASKFGYFDGHYGRSSTGQTGALIVVAEGQWVRDLTVGMTRGGTITGAVLDDHAEPLVNAYVRVLRQIRVGGQPQIAAGPIGVTDDRGVYRISRLAAGEYFVVMPSVQNAVPATTTTATLARVDAKSVAAMEAAGRTVTFDDPVVEADAQNQIVIGRYPMPPRSSDGRPRAYPVTFFPAAQTIASATPVVLSAGEERGGIDLRVSPVPTVRISGLVDGPPESVRNLTLRLMLPGTEDLGQGSEVATALVGAGVRFTFVNVPAGVYVLDARPVVAELQVGGLGTGAQRFLPATPGVLGSLSGGLVFSAPEFTELPALPASGSGGYWARQTVVVEDRDIANLVVTMHKSVALMLHGAWEDGRPTVAPGQAPDTIYAASAHGSASLGVIRSRFEVSPPDTFVLEGLMPGEYAIGASQTIKSIVCGGRDHTYLPFDASTGSDFTDCSITFTERTVRISGTVRDARGKAARETAVIVFPAERAQWNVWGPQPARAASLQVSTAGGYRFQPLPEGDYYVIAVPVDLLSAWQEPKFLEAAAPEATRVRLAWSKEGKDVVQDLTLKAITWDPKR